MHVQVLGVARMSWEVIWWQGVVWLAPEAAVPLPNRLPAGGRRGGRQLGMYVRL